MNENTPTQAPLFPTGEGGTKLKPMKKRKTADLIARAEELVKLCRSNKNQYAIHRPKVDEWRHAVKEQKDSKWVKVGDDFMPRDIAKLIVKFCDNYESQQMELIEEVKQIQQVLKVRHIGFPISDELYPYEVR